MKQIFSRLGWVVSILVLSLGLVACERALQQEPVTTEELTTPGPSIPTLDPNATAIIPPSGDLATPDSTMATPETGLEPATDATSEGETAEPVVPEPTEAVPTEDIIYTVVAGDTLGKIAERYGLTVEEIAVANNLTSVHTLDVGQQLLLPLSGEVQAETPPPAEAEATEAPPPAEEQVHIVQAGDNLYRIGLQYGFTIEELVAYNNLTNPNRLEVGQQIRIPPQGYTVP